MAPSRSMPSAMPSKIRARCIGSISRHPRSAQAEAELRTAKATVSGPTADSSEFVCPVAGLIDSKGSMPASHGTSAPAISIGLGSGIFIFSADLHVTIIARSAAMVEPAWLPPLDTVAQQGSAAENAMREFSIGKGGKQSHDSGQVQAQHHGQRLSPATQPERKTTSTDQEQQGNESLVHRFLGLVAMQRVAPEFQAAQPGRANEQTETACDPENFWQARPIVGGCQAKEIVVYRCDAGGGKTQQKPVESAMMKAPARQRMRIIFIVTASAMAAIEVFQAQNGIGGLCCRRARQRRATGDNGDVAQKSAHPDSQGQARKQKHPNKQQHQDAVRENVVKISAPAHLPWSAVGEHCLKQKQGQEKYQRQRNAHTVVLVELPQRRWPGIVRIGLDTHARHGPGHVDGKLVRRCVLACTQASATVVAQVGQEVDIGFSEFQPAGHRREYGTKSFAIAAGVANLHLTRHFGFSQARHDIPVRQSPRRARQRIKQLHGRSPFSVTRVLHWFRQSGQMPCRSTCPPPPYTLYPL